MMKNKYLSKAIAQQGLYEFKRQLQYKCGFYGIEFVEADKWYPSSKICIKCGYKNTKLSLSERIYIYEECEAVIDRYFNASINHNICILKYMHKGYNVYKLIVYHGSYCIVDTTHISFSRDDLDFGKGFYVTKIKEQAINWTNKFKT